MDAYELDGRKSKTRIPSQSIFYALNALNGILPHELQPDHAYSESGYSERGSGCISGIFQQAVQSSDTRKQLWGLVQTSRTLNYKSIKFAEAVKTSRDLHSVFLYHVTILDEGKENEKLIKKFNIQLISPVVQTWVNERKMSCDEIKDTLVSLEERHFLAEGFTRMPIQLYPERHYSVFRPS